MEYWINEETPRQLNLLIRYNPIEYLQTGHPTATLLPLAVLMPNTVTPAQIKVVASPTMVR